MQSYVVVDIETTGLSPTQHKITEIGALKIQNGKPTHKFSALIHIGERVPYHITKITGITTAMLEKDGHPLHFVLQAFMDFKEDLPLIAHNARFDIGFLQKASATCGINFGNNPVVDTIKLAKQKRPGLKSYSLSNLATALGIDINRLLDKGYSLHRGLGDCILTHQVYKVLMDD